MGILPAKKKMLLWIYQFVANQCLRGKRVCKSASIHNKQQKKSHFKQQGKSCSWTDCHGAPVPKTQRWATNSSPYESQVTGHDTTIVRYTINFISRHTRTNIITVTSYEEKGLFGVIYCTVYTCIHKFAHVCGYTLKQVCSQLRYCIESKLGIVRNHDWLCFMLPSIFLK